MNRKQRRAHEKQAGKEATENLAEKISLFQSLPDLCLTCEKPYDKKSKEMAKTWSVVVRDEKSVRLYCPDCWKMANNLIEDWKKEIENARE